MPRYIDADALRERIAYYHFHTGDNQSTNDEHYAYGVVLEEIDKAPSVNVDKVTRELKPCPFCGGEVKPTPTSHFTSQSCMGYEFEIRCLCCGIKSPKRYRVQTDFETLLESLSDFTEPFDYWNRRMGEKNNA